MWTWTYGFEKSVNNLDKLDAYGTIWYYFIMLLFDIIR